MMTIRSLSVALLATTLCATAAAAQAVELRGRGDVDNDIFLARLLERGGYVVLARDTLIGQADTVRGTALAVGARVRLEGVVTGDLVLVDANVFLRPTARVLGSVRNIGGGLYPSELATVAGGVHSEPNAPYQVRELDDATIVIQGLTRRAAFVPAGIFGLLPPTYDRVDALTLRTGASLMLPRVERVEPLLRARLDYRTRRQRLTGGLELGLPRGRTELAAGVERTTATSERWILGDIENSLTFIFAGNDYRDYWEADRAYVELRRTLETGPRTFAAFLRGQLEEARTLEAGSPWTLFGTPRQDNIVVDERRIASLLAGGRLDWSQPLHIVRVAGILEAAGSVFQGEHTFNRYEVDADWAMAALRVHTLRIHAHASGPLPGTDSLPGQRWSFVGGSHTLETFDIAQFRGDRVAFVETRYTVPFPRLRIRFLGRPDLELAHAAGMAWTQDSRPPLEQNLGVRVRFPLVNLRVAMDPSRPPRYARFAVGFNLPRRSYPWETE
jgi:hypothetical protein